MLLEDGVMLYVNFPMREKFWPLHSNRNSCRWKSGQITEKEAAATQPRPASLSQVYLFFLNALQSN
jgi:hypothetical protein